MAKIIGPVPAPGAGWPRMTQPWQFVMFAQPTQGVDKRYGNGGFADATAGCRN